MEFDNFLVVGDGFGDLAVGLMAHGEHVIRPNGVRMVGGETELHESDRLGVLTLGKKGLRQQI